MSPEEVTVSVDDAHVADVHEVAERLREAGLSIDELSEELGVISGTIDESKADALREIDGVASVERSRDYQLPRPDSEVQ
jgi:hypothetical protein